MRASGIAARRCKMPGAFTEFGVGWHGFDHGDDLTTTTSKHDFVTAWAVTTRFIITCLSTLPAAADIADAPRGRTVIRNENAASDAYIRAAPHLAYASLWDDRNIEA